MKKKIFKQVAADSGYETADYYQGGSLAAGGLAKIEEHLAGKPAARPLNLLPCGLVPGQLNVICSLPGMGKSAYLVNLVLEMQDRKLSPLIFVPESDMAEFGVKALCARAGVDVNDLRRGRMKKEKWPALKAAGLKLEEHPLLICANTELTAGRLPAEVRRVLDGGNKCDAVIIDSLNYLQPQEGEWLGFKLAELADLARELKTTVICSYGVPSLEDEAPAARCGQLRLADTALAECGRREAHNIYQLHRAEYFDRADPTLRHKATLRRLYPFLGRGTPELNLCFSGGSLRFSLIPAIGPGKTEDDEKTERY